MPDDNQSRVVLLTGAAGCGGTRAGTGVPRGRPLPLAGGRVFSSIDVLASRVKLKARALHEGDLLGFIAELSDSRQGFYPVDQCDLKRIEGPVLDVRAHVEADCTLEWITLKDTRSNHAG